MLTGIVTTSKVIGSIFLAADELLGVEKLAVGPSPNLVYDGGLEIDEDSPWNMLAGPSLAEEGVEGIVATTNALVTRHLPIRLQNSNTQKKRFLMI